MAIFAEEELFKRDLSEVHLLIDFISGRADKSLAGLTGISNYDQTGAPTTPALSPQAVVAQICAISYPPSGGLAANAREAAFMLVVKDKLNELANPARGLTVAFTSMFAGVSLPVTDSLWVRLGRLLSNRFSGRKREDLSATSKLYSARMAYPHLELIALRFRSFFWRQPFWALALILAITLANWDISTSGAVLKQIAGAEVEHSKLFTADHGFLPFPGNCLNQTSLPSIAGGGPPRPAKPAADTPVSPPSQSADDRARDVSCEAAAAAIAERDAGLSNLDRLIRRRTWWTSVVATGVRFFDSQAGSRSETLRPPAASGPWSPSRLEDLTLDVVNALNTVVLPMMFGWLGTLVGVMRSITIKLRDNTLAPRDFGLARISIFLGMTAGLAVGLFFNSSDPGGATSKSLGGNISVSAAGLAFLAGFGAEAFFAFLDAALVRLMPASTAQSGPPHGLQPVQPALIPPGDPAMPGGQPGGEQNAGAVMASAAKVAEERKAVGGRPDTETDSLARP